MPTATAFLRAAGELESVSDELIGVIRPARQIFDGGVLVGGSLTAAVGELIETDEAAVRDAGRELDDLAAECRRRADVCEV